MQITVNHSSLTCLLAATIAATVLAGCRGPDVDKPATGRLAVKDTGTAPPAKPVESPPPSPSLSPSPLPPMVIAAAPPGTIYVCVTDAAGQPRQTVIELQPKVAALCRKAPEMGPCQFEREACRRNGGRVFAVDGTEITRQTEAEYDKRVMRIRMKAN
jgi:hypothetical protein